ncbi:DNA ligase [Vibrio sp.]|uniref:DNA ligase n=1 Tax=Vibrio sp. TaxID=678 RepID=UPI0037BBA58B
MMRLTKLAVATLWAFSLPSHSSYLPPEQLVLANTYKQGIDVSEYWTSEKLDGIRALWDGKHLYTRNGNRIYAPRWFTESLPEVHLEGELWAGRGKFHLVQSTVLDHTPSDTAWRQIDFMLFDMPGAAGDYQKRYYNILHWVSMIDESHVGYVEHSPIKNEETLFHQLDNVDERDGEGLMLRKITSRYQAGRSNDLLKLKRHHDAEATVIGYKTGTGKYKGMMGSILVHNEQGVEFYIGSRITFRYNGLTQNGKPKFARFVREKSDY